MAARKRTTQSSTSEQTAFQRQSRAVVRDIDPGSEVKCVQCGERVKFKAKARGKQVICNVYIDGTWKKVEHFHLACYEEAGSPHGEAIIGTDYRRQAATAAAAERAEQLAAEEAELLAGVA
mgnify:CR=1 FL=1